MQYFRTMINNLFITNLSREFPEHLLGYFLDFLVVVGQELVVGVHTVRQDLLFCVALEHVGKEFRHFFALGSDQCDLLFSGLSAVLFAHVFKPDLVLSKQVSQVGVALRKKD